MSSVHSVTSVITVEGVQDGSTKIPETHGENAKLTEFMKTIFG